MESVSLVIRTGGFRQCAYAEHKDDTDWIKCCITMEVEGVRKT